MRALRGATAVLGTRHKKERVMAPILRERLEMTVRVHGQFDSDRFGSFTREIPRRTSAQECVRQKAIDSPAALAEAPDREIKSGGVAWIESDMRAHANPTRMRSIERATRSLATNLLRQCPRCEAFGYSLLERLSGLPCEECGGPTARARADLFRCASCGLSEAVPIDSLAAAPAFACQKCNP